MSWWIAVVSGAVALAAMLLAVTRPSVVHALMYLVVALVAVGAAFFALGAAFAGAIQILVYAGAVVAVFVFVIMTVDSSRTGLARERGQLAASWRAPAVLAGLGVLPVAVGLLAGGGATGSPAPVGARDLGLLLFGPWAVATELASLLLLAALLGVRHVGRRLGETHGEEER